jgi:GAF domain-containing protein
MKLALPVPSVRLDFPGFDLPLEIAPEKTFDDLAWLAARLCNAPIAIVSLNSARGQRAKSKVGLTVSEATGDFGFCEEALTEKKLFIVTDVARDSHLATDPWLQSAKVRFLASLPLVISDGTCVGTLSVMDRIPRQLTCEQLYALEVLGRQLLNQLEWGANINSNVRR